MNLAPAGARLLFNPLFRALWIGMIASSLASALLVDGTGVALPAASPAALITAAVRIVTSPPMRLLLLLCVVVSLYKQRHGALQFAFRKMGSDTFAVSIFTFLGLAGPWFLLCAACILGLCAAMAVLSLQPVLLELLGKAELTRGLASGLLRMSSVRTAGNLACGVLATVVGPAAIFILSAISLGVAVIADSKANPRGAGTAPASTW